MKKALVVGSIASIVALNTLAHADPVCERKVEVRTHKTLGSEAADWDVAMFIQLFESVLWGAGIQFPASPPEYVASGSFNTKGKGSALGIGIGFTGGAAPSNPSWVGAKNPIAYYGDRVFVAGWNHPSSKDPGTYVPYATSAMAAEGGLVNLIRRYERIPTSAKAKLDVKCFKPGETRTIYLFDLTSPYEARRSGQVKDRLIVEADEGKITNGTKVQAGDGRVFVVSASRRSDDRVTVIYKAPKKDDLEKDTLHVHNSCEVRSPGIFPLGRTAKKNEILEFEVPICKVERELEYNHRMTIFYGGSNMKYTVKGKVPFHLKDREGNIVRTHRDRYKKDELKLEGKGTLSVTMKGPAGDDCFMSYTSTMDATIKGKAKNEKGYWYLYPEIKENYAKQFTMTVTCDDDTMTKTMTLPAPPVNYPKGKLRFRDKDGKKITGPFKGAGGRGTYELILHVPDRY